MESTTRKEVFAEAEAEILRREGAIARSVFSKQLGYLAPEALEKIDEMCTNNSLKSMVSWLKSQRYLWFIGFGKLNPCDSDEWNYLIQKRFITVTPADYRWNSLKPY